MNENYNSNASAKNKKICNNQMKNSPFRNKQTSNSPAQKINLNNYFSNNKSKK